MFEWTQKRIEWYERAVEWTECDKILSAALKPYLAQGDTVCDLGCGTGYLGLELAHQGFAVSAVDISHEAMGCLAKKIAVSKPGFEMLVSDWADITGRQWDNVIMCLTGNFNTELSYYLSLCKKKLIVMGNRRARWSTNHPLGGKSNMSDELTNILKDANLDFIFQEISVELGQPFLSLDEAREYLRDYGITGEAFGNAMDMIEQTGHIRYPYYLPYKKEMGIWVINKTEPISI